MATSKYIPGIIVSTPKGDVRILSRKSGKNLPNGKKLHPRLVIEILETGTVLDIQQGNLILGKFNDYRKRTVYGVGYIGSPLTIPDRGSNNVIRRVYDLWANMLKRVYGGYKSCAGYGDVLVDSRWHNFTNFLNTVSKIPGYGKWERGEAFVLDKDLSGTRLYSINTCRFIPASENSQEASLRRWHGSRVPCKRY